MKNKANEFGKFLQELRLSNKEKLKEMASNLDVTSQFLSALENGKKNIGNGIIEKIIDRYKLSEEQVFKLNNAVLHSNDHIKFKIAGLNEYAVKMLATLFRKYENLSDKEIEKILKILGE